MKTIFLDFETYYSTREDYTLRKVTPVEYILDPRFETIGCAVVMNGLSTFMTHDQLKVLFAQLPEQVAVVSHNALFDMCVLAYRYDYVPTLMIDTMGMSKAWWGHEVRSHALAYIAEAKGIGAKGTEVYQMDGKRLRDIVEQGLWPSYSRYSVNDAELCAKIYYKIMGEGFPVEELLVQDMVLRCAVQPKFALDRDILHMHLNEVQQQKEALLASVGVERSELMSNDKFAVLLQGLGIDPPRKTSLATGMETWAFSKTDPYFMALEDHEDPDVQALIAARIGTKSTLEESRTKRFISISNLTWAGNEQCLMPVPLSYGAAHTHRLGGAWKLNLQNMPRGSKSKPPRLRKSLRARKGKIVVKADASQIEARFVMSFCGQKEGILRFERGEDSYSALASEIFGFPVDKSYVPERFVGKTAFLGCLAEGTLVLCERGWVPIEQVELSDRVWDGEEWVCHQGLLKQGLKETLEICGLWLTPDHLVFCGAEWRAADSILHDQNFLSQILATGAENLPLLDTSLPSKVRGSQGSWLNAIAGHRSMLSINIALKTLGALVATSVQKSLRHVLENYIGDTQTCSLMTSTESGFLIDSPLQFPAAILLPVKSSTVTAGAASVCSRAGVTIGEASLSTFKRSLDGITPNSIWTGKTTTEIMNPVTLDLLPKARMPITDEKLKSCRRTLMTYDLACAGPKNRFMVATNAGAVIVHNCGFGVGGEKFARTIRLQSKALLGTAIDMSDAEGARVVGVYRNQNNMVPMMWRRLDNAIPAMMRKDCELKIGPITIEHERVRLPNGLFLNYKGLHRRDIKPGESEWAFTYAGIPNTLYGGKFLENIIQALARIATMEAAVRIRHRLTTLAHEYGIDPGLFDLGLQEHDALVYCPPIGFEDAVGEILIEEMERRPTWHPEVPLACQDGYAVGSNYGDAK